MYVAIKVKDQKEYKEAEKLLIEKGFNNCEQWNNEIYDLIESNKLDNYILIFGKDFEIHSHDGGYKVFENINEFLKQL